MLSKLPILMLVFSNVLHSVILREKKILFFPEKFNEKLPSLSMPYISDLRIPNIFPDIKPSPVVTTKAISIVTKYVTRSPVCIKNSGNKPPCAPSTRGAEHLITKEYFIKKSKNLPQDELIRSSEGSRENIIEREFIEKVNLVRKETPELKPQQMREMLIEDRLDLLEDILPQYTRLRVYQTSTITVTKTWMHDKTTATLTVKNCVPEGIDFCKTSKKRKSRLDDEVFNVLGH